MNHCRRIFGLKLNQSVLLARNSVPAPRNSSFFNSALVKSHENCPSLVKLSQQYYSTEHAKDDLTKKFDTMVKESPVVVFMKGVPSQPMCGFSNAVVQILRMHGVEYKAHNVLEDETIRQGIKEYSNWPTIPQVYIGGDFVGGCDILLQMHRSGELIEELEKCGIRSALLDEAEKTPPEKKE